MIFVCDFLSSSMSMSMKSSPLFGVCDTVTAPCAPADCVVVMHGLQAKVGTMIG